VYLRAGCVPLIRVACSSRPPYVVEPAGAAGPANVVAEQVGPVQQAKHESYRIEEQLQRAGCVPCAPAAAACSFAWLLVAGGWC
jgi:hypothetical protein